MPGAVRVGGGLCDKPARHPVKVRLPSHDYIRYVKEAELYDIYMCDEHFALIKVGWQLKPTIIFQWVPPK